MTTTIAPPTDLVINAEHEELLDALKAKESVLLIGGAGRGKSTSTLWAAEQLGLDPNTQYTSIDVNPQMDMTELMGKQVCIGPGEWAFEGGPVLKRYQHGGLLCVNEITSTRADVAHNWHPIAWREPLTVTAAAGEMKVGCDDEFYHVGTSNGQEYAGNYMLSPAFYNRYYIMEWKGLTVDEEGTYWQKKYPKVLKGHIDRILSTTREWSGANRGVYEISMRDLNRCLRRLNGIEQTDKDGFARIMASTLVRPVRILASSKAKSLVEAIVPSFKGMTIEMIEKHL